MLPLGGGIASALFHSRPTPSPSTCKAAFEHDTTGTVLSSLIIAGLLLSYAPQYIRIIRHKNSEGFSPLFLLLGATSSASSLGNIVTLQWGQVACCQYLVRTELLSALDSAKCLADRALSLSSARASVLPTWICTHSLNLFLLIVHASTTQTKGQCAESVLGIAQVFTQWFCFSLIFILYLVYYPLSSKYVRSVPIASSALPRRKPFLTSLVPEFMRTTTPSNLIRPSHSSASLISDVSSADDETDDERAFNPSTFLLPGQLRRGEIILSSEYRHAVSLFLLTVLHFLLTFLTTFILLLTLPKAETPHQGTPSPWDPVPGNGGGREHPSERAVRVWATTLGLVSVALGCAQYAPQLVHTARRRLVGSLSIPMMMLQTPGSFVFVYTLAIRPGVNFTGWATYFVTGVLQGTLLVLCLVFRRRQKREGVDDWGEPLPGREGEGERAGERGGERERLLR